MPVHALAALAASALDLPPLPRPEEGYLAVWEWLRTANSALSIPDAEFRWMFGGFSIPILLLFEVVGIRKDWKLYPFLVPFWLLFGSVALGVVGGLAATAAHLVLFPLARLRVVARERRRAGEAPARDSAGIARAAVTGARPPRDVAGVALAALRAAGEELRAARAAGAGAGRASDVARGAIVRALRAALGEAARAAERGSGDRQGEPRHEPQRPAARDPGRRPAAPGAPPGRPDLSAFRPDLSRFRRRPPRG
jgi:hypothetical protein